MRFYKFAIILSIGLFLELLVAVLTSVVIKQNGEWLASLTLPYFAPHSLLFYGALSEVLYFSSALSLSFYVETRDDLPKGVLLTLLEGSAEILTLLFFFKFTYEIISFFLATATMILSFCNTSFFLSKRNAAGIARFPVFTIHLYFWAILYCILMINFA